MLIGINCCSINFCEGAPQCSLAEATYRAAALRSDQPHALQRGMPVAPDDDVVMHGDAQ